jgi:hypothetical protein
MPRVLAIIAAVMLVACGGSDTSNDQESPEAAAKRHLEMFGKQQHGRAWDELHPAHQALVGRDQYLLCGSSTSIDKVEVVESYEEPLTVDEIGTVDSVAVTMRAFVGERSQNVTLHVIDVDGRWRWVMSPETIARCQEA